MLEAWLPAEPGARLLKTDLWDEAVGAGLYATLATHARRVVGLDLAATIVTQARAHHPGLLAAAADVRHLPFADGAFDVVLSNSTLDHFHTRAEIAASLRELFRVLRPGGLLLITLDNRANPTVAVRNALPFGLLHRLGLVPYFVGATLGPRGLRGALTSAGFEITRLGALLHCPRALAIRQSARLERGGSPEAQQRFLQRLLRWERLANWPTRFLTGYYVAALARKPAATPGANA